MDAESKRPENGSADPRVLLETACGQLRGLNNGRCREFRGLRFARAERFAYAEPVERWEGVYDATSFGPSCPQNRAVHEHLEHPTRRFTSGNTGRAWNSATTRTV